MFRTKSFITLVSFVVAIGLNIIAFSGCGDNAEKVEIPSGMFQLNQDDNSANANMPGMIGIICEKENFVEPASIDIIKHLNHNWTGGPGNWSGYWQGYIEAPFSGEINFYAEVENGMRIMIDETIVIDKMDPAKPLEAKQVMTKGEKYPLKVWYFQDGGPSYIRVYWSWEGQEKVIIDEESFSYSSEDMKYAVSMLPTDFWSDEEAPFNFDGSGSEPLDLAYQDARLLPVVGVENYQVFRSNRAHTEFTGGMNKTYIHAPMICYWNNKFYLEFLAAPVNEHDANTETLLTSSLDGKNWETPKIIFPAFVPDRDTEKTIAHQRMGFYVSKDDRLLVMAFYGKVPSPNEGFGVGRAVREVYKDGSLGPLYFIRYNRHAGYNEDNTPFPYYKTSPDKGFVDACDELMANKVFVQQWWEEDRSEDGFYLMSGDGFKCKAFNWYTRKDGIMVGLFKAGYASYSDDAGKTWSDIHKIPTIIVGHAKMWGQQTDDGNFALIYNPHFEWRYPLVVETSSDGENFKNMTCVHGELPPMRYQGGAKDVGPQYMRGITEGNGNPPGNDLWMTYSMHKEDIWTSRIPVPVRHSVDKWVDDNFNNMTAGGSVTEWNIYSLIWAPVNVVDFPSRSDKSLMMKDSEPYDYAKALRVFPESKTVTTEFEVLTKQNDTGRLEIELTSKKGYRPVRVMLNDKGMIQAVDGEKVVDLIEYTPQTWIKVKIKADVETHKYSLWINGNEALADAGFAENVSELQRLTYRTGEYRKLGIGKKENENDLPNSDLPVPEAVYYLNNVKINK